MKFEFLNFVMVKRVNNDSARVCVVSGELDCGQQNIVSVIH